MAMQNSGTLTSVEGYPVRALYSSASPVIKPPVQSGAVRCSDQTRSAREGEQASRARAANACPHVRERPRSENIHKVTRAFTCAAGRR